MARQRKPIPTPDPEPVVVDVRSVTQFAHNAGLSCELAERLLLAAPDEDCDVRELLCGSAVCGSDRTRHLVAPGLFDGRAVLFCEGCGQADLWL